jgi:hypothetical protein
MSMPSLLSITYHFFLQIAVILLTYRLLWPLFRRLAQVQVVAIMVAGFLLGPSVLGWIWARWAALAVPHKADHRCRNVHTPEPHGHLRRRPTWTRALHVSGGSVVQAGHPRRTRQAGWCHLGRRHRCPSGPRWRRGMVDGRPQWIFHARWCIGREVCSSQPPWHHGVPDVGVDRLDSGLLNTRLGTMALSCAAVDDACSWVLLATVVATANGSLFGAFLAIGGGLAYLLFMVYVGRPLLGRLETWTPLRADVERTGGLPIAHTSIVLLVVLTASWFTDLVGIYSVFRAFVAGAVMPRVRCSRRSASGSNRWSRICCYPRSSSIRG